MPQRIEDAFAARIATFATDVTDQALTPPSGSGQRGRSVSSRAPRAIRFGRFGSGRSEKIDKSGLAFPEPRRVRDHNHVRFTAKQPCLVCRRRPSDTHHVRLCAKPRDRPQSER